MARKGEDTRSLSTVPETELKERVKRLENLLSNLKILEKLDDKGEKVRKKISAAEEEIKRRESVREATVKFERMDIQDPSDDPKQNNGRSHETAFPKFCTKLEEYDRHREVRSTFKPFRYLERPPEITSECVPKSRQDPPVRGISVMSLNESLELASLRRPVLRNLLLEDSTLFAENRGDSESDDDGSQQYGSDSESEQALNHQILEEVD